MSGEEAPLICCPRSAAHPGIDAAALTDDETADRDPLMPRGVFRRTGCLVAPHPTARYEVELPPKREGMETGGEGGAKPVTGRRRRFRHTGSMA